MFPQDVIANAPRIISDMRRFFPPHEGSFLIGPMAKLGWGTPTLISASLGVIIEIPPANIAILGVIKCVLPDEDAALLVLQVKFIGAIEPTKQRLWFFASLYGSRVLFITIGGRDGAACRLGRRAQFRAQRRRLPPAVPAAADALPHAAADRAVDPRHQLRAHPRRGLFRRHLEHRAVRRELGAVLRGSTSSRSKAI
ncbi:MAG: DUF6603 domain-containing protein [Sphingomonas sp.]